MFEIFLKKREEYKKDYNIFSSFALFNKYFKSLKQPFTIQIIGTNGKGSTGRFLAQMLESDKKVGHFSSPHIFSFNERFYKEGKEASNEELERAHLKLKALFKEDFEELSYFEYACFLIPFVFKDCDYWILEAGLGGEYDSTTAFKKDLCIISHISLDHTQILGQSLEKIANTKLRAINCPTLISKHNKESVIKIAKKIAFFREKELLIEKDFKDLENEKLQKSLNEKIEKLNMSLNFLKSLLKEEGTNKELEGKIEELNKNLVLLNPKKNLEKISNLKESLVKYPIFLKNNANLAINAYYMLKKSLPNSLPKLNLRARLEKISDNIFIDVGHNEEAALAMKKYFRGKKINLIYNSFKDKDSLGVLKALKPILKTVFIFYLQKSDRAFLNKDLVGICKKLKLSCYDYKDIKKDELYLVFGSFYLVSAFLKDFGER